MHTVPCIRCGGPGEHFFRLASRKTLRRQHVDLRRQRGANIQHRGQRLVIDAGAPCRHSRGRVRIRRDSEQRLPGVLHQLGREDGIVVYRAPVIVLSRNIGGHRNRDHSRKLPHGREVYRTNPSVSDATHAKRRVQSVRRKGDIIRVQCAATDVEMCAFVTRGHNFQADAATASAVRVGPVEPPCSK